MRQAVVRCALFAMGATYFLNRLIQWSRRCRCKTKLTGKIVVITGANSGIGAATAKILANKGATVVLACRSLQSGLQTATEIARSTGSDKTYVIQLDASDLESLRRFSAIMHNNFSHIDVLINNAGVFFLPGNPISKDGCNLTMATNYLGPICLMFLLLDMLAVRTPSRIINVSSQGYELARDVTEADLYFAENEHNKFEIYGKSKLALNLASIFLSGRLANSRITVNLVNPGNVRTNVLRHLAEGSWFYKLFLRLVATIFFKTPTEGAQTVVHLALCKDFDHKSGGYFVNCKETELKEYSKDNGAFEPLWAITRQVMEREGVALQMLDAL